MRSDADAPFEIRPARDAELKDALEVQHAAFERVARMLGIRPEDISAATEPLSALQAARDAGAAVFVACADGRVVGTVRSWMRDDGVLEIGRLAVDEAYERRGIGSALIRAAEAAYPDAGRIELFTGAVAEGPLSLYRGLGYEVFRRDQTAEVGIVWLAKTRR